MSTVCGNVVITIGLVMDIFGVIMLSKELMVSENEADKLSTTRIGHSPRLKKLFLVQSRNAKIGLALLVFGFTFQIIGIWLR